MAQLLARAFSNLRYNEEGQTLFEYALILTLVSVTAVALLSVLGAYAPSILGQVTADL